MKTTLILAAAVISALTSRANVVIGGNDGVPYVTDVLTPVKVGDTHTAKDNTHHYPVNGTTADGTQYYFSHVVDITAKSNQNMFDKYDECWRFYYGNEPFVSNNLCPEGYYAYAIGAEIIKGELDVWICQHKQEAYHNYEPFSDADNLSIFLGTLTPENKVLYVQPNADGIGFPYFYVYVKQYEKPGQVSGDDTFVKSLTFKYMPKSQTGVDDLQIADDDNQTEPAKYFTLQGAQVDAQAITPGLYVKRQGSKTQKIIIK